MNKQIEEIVDAIEFQLIVANATKTPSIALPAKYGIFLLDLLRKQSEGKLIDATIEQIIRKKAEVSKYWQDYVKQYRAIQGYSDIEQDVDNFLRGYGEAVEDIIAILDGMKGGE